MPQTLEQKRNQVRGYLFEVIVRLLLQKAGYLPITPDGEHIRLTDGHVRGRGYWHDIDALGRYQYPLFYMYPIRLLAEVKCYDGDVPIWAVRNFVGALKDIAENYFVADKLSREQLIAYQRFTDCGSFFFATGYSIGAQRYALAQGVFLVSYENNPILSNIMYRMNRVLESVDIAAAAKEKKEFVKWIDRNLRTDLRHNYQSAYVPNIMTQQFNASFSELHNDINFIQLSAIAMITGNDPSIQYPVHMLSKNRLPEEFFAETDTQRFRVYYNETPKGLFFEARLPERQFSLFFSLSGYVYQQYFKEKRMLDLKCSLLEVLNCLLLLKESDAFSNSNLILIG